jgi:membrane protein involved in colicin uptake
VAGSLTPDQEAKARAALEDAQKQLASIPNTTANAPRVDSAAELKSKRELIKQQEREGKKRRAAEKKAEEAANKKRLEQEAKMKKEIDRLNREEEAKAKAEARRQLEAEAKVRKQEARVRDTKTAAPVVEPARPVESAAPAVAPAPVVTKAAPPAETRSKTSSVPAGGGVKTKQQRLDELTQSYVQDKISAQDYYRERTKILSEPGE